MMIPPVDVPDPETGFPGNRCLFYKVKKFRISEKVTKSWRTTPHLFQKVVLVFHYDPYICRKFVRKSSPYFLQKLVLVFHYDSYICHKFVRKNCCSVHSLLGVPRSRQPQQNCSIEGVEHLHCLCCRRVLFSVPQKPYFFESRSPMFTHHQ